MSFGGREGGGNYDVCLLEIFASEPHDLGEAGEGGRSVDDVKVGSSLWRGAEGFELIEVGRGSDGCEEADVVGGEGGGEGGGLVEFLLTHG